MNDEQQDAQVRALLAGLRSGDGEEDAVPPQVAARLEETLAGLVAERRRRRWVPRLAAAAAAVIVVGAGGLTAANLGVFDDSRSADSTAGAESGPDTGPDSGAADSGAAESGADLAATPDLASATFAEDVAVLLEEDPDLGAPPRSQARESPGPAVAAACPGPAGPKDTAAVPVRLDGDLAVLLVHPPREGRTLVEAWTCPGDRRLAAARLAR